MKLSELRNVYNYAQERDHDFKSVVKSIKQGYLSDDEYESECYIEYEDKFYSSDDYVIDYNGNLVDICDAFFCEYMEDWFHIDETSTVYIGGGEERYSDRYLSRGTHDFYSYDGEWYDSCALDWHNLVFDYVGEIVSRDDVYYWESDNEYHYEPECEGYVRSYHYGGTSYVDFDGTSPYRIGFEIEKEDYDIKTSIEIDDFESNTEHKWRKEKDGSLNDESGYELISPAFEFDIDKIFNHIESNNVLLDHINAGYSVRCGGHINLSHEDLSGEELFDMIKGYAPILYALYYGRIGGSYATGKSIEDLKKDKQKMQAINIQSNRIEFRIFSAVSSVTNLRWRSRLIQKFLEFPTDDVKNAYYYFDTKFNDLIREVYDTDEKYQKLKYRVIKYTLQYEGIRLDDNDNFTDPTTITE